MILGLLVVVIVGTLVVKYLKNDRGLVPQGTETQNNSIERVNKTHKVAKGESLWMIAEEYYGDGFKWVDIATENKLANASIIETDQELIIPEIGVDAEQPEIATADNTQKLESVNAITSATYEVVKGDSLWKIAVRAYGDGYKWVEIAKANKITNPNVIYKGNVLALPR